ncbi:MAG: tRNA guanosine(34) transglycosylase Tgt [Opitutaceae bacterium]
MSTQHFQILARDPVTAARRGRLQTAHGVVETPIFMPVGTQATVKAMTPAQLEEIGAQIILGNTYHLALKPGPELIQQFGGLHRFMHWERPILTDSGGFQVFSLAKLRRIRDDGIFFQSHHDGREFFLGPKEAIAWQTAFGSDIAMVIDECPPYPCERDACREAVDRSRRWARECLSLAGDSGMLERRSHLFAIVQGSVYDDMRREEAEALAAMGFPGYAIGGVSVGEPEEEMLRQVGVTTPHLPEDRPRYTMGLGTPAQILKMIALGVDMFDCVMPSRLARNGTVFTPDGVINLRNERFRDLDVPLVEGLDNYTCRHFSVAYLRHLIMANEILGSTLLTLHNIHFFLDLVRQAQVHIEAGDFGPWHRAWISRYESGAS